MAILKSPQELNLTNPNVGAQVYIWNSDGTLFPGWPQNTACYPANNYCGITAIILADLDNDLSLEVIAGTDNLYLTNPDPNLLYVPNLYVWRSDGELVAGNWPVEDDRNIAILGPMAVDDLNDDGQPEIVTGPRL